MGKPISVIDPATVILASDVSALWGTDTDGPEVDCAAATGGLKNNRWKRTATKNDIVVADLMLGMQRCKTIRSVMIALRNFRVPKAGRGQTLGAGTCRRICLVAPHSDCSESAALCPLFAPSTWVAAQSSRFLKRNEATSSPTSMKPTSQRVSKATSCRPAPRSTTARTVRMKWVAGRTSAMYCAGTGMPS